MSVKSVKGVCALFFVDISTFVRTFVPVGMCEFETVHLTHSLQSWTEVTLPVLVAPLFTCVLEL